MPIPFQLSVEQNRTIRGDFFPARSEAQGTLIICHGYKGFKDWGFFPYLGERLSEDINVVTFNFSHNGVGGNPLEFTELEKFAHNTYSRELEDLRLLVTQLKNGNLLPDRSEAVFSPPLFLLGHSRGGGVSLIYAFDHPEDVAGVVNWNGITNVDLFSEEEKEAMRKHGRAYVLNARTQQQMPLDVEIIQDIEKNHERFNIIKRAKTANTPITLIQGTEDFARLRAGSAKLKEGNPAISWISVPGGDHTFGARHPFQGTTEPLEEAIKQTLTSIAASITSSLNS